MMTNRPPPPLARFEAADPPRHASERSPGHCALTDRIAVQRPPATTGPARPAVGPARASEGSPWPYEIGSSADPFALHLRDGAAMMAAPVQRKRATESQLAGAATDMPVESAEVRALNLARSALESAETDAQNLFEQVSSGALSHDRAYGRVALIMQSMLGPLATFDSAQRADRQRLGETSGAWFGADDTGGQHEALDRWRPRVLDSLNNVTRVALSLSARERAAGGAMTRAVRVGLGLIEPDAAQDQVAMEAMVGALASVGASLGWSPPVTIADADARRYAHEACPTGAREERPDHCNLPDVERLALRGAVVDRIATAIKNFIVVCGRHKAQLEAMVAKIAAGRELILGIVTDAIKAGISAATAGTGRVLDFALSVGFTLAKARLKLPSTKDSIPQADSVSMLDSLQAALLAHLEAIGEKTSQLDDRALRELDGSLESLTVEFFEEKLTPFVAAYRAQIEPIGHPGPLHRDRVQGAVYRSVWAITGERRRLALVVDDAYTPDGPALRERETQHVYRFERWIDPQFEPVAGGDAVEVPAEKIDEIPLMFFVAGASP